MSDRPSDILIFGAGFGTRMAPLTDHQPKPLVKVAGKALIDHAIDLANDAQLRVHVNTHYRADQLAKHLSGKATIHREEPTILDTGGGLKAALPSMDGDPVMTLNSDAIWNGPNPLKLLIDNWQPGMSALLLLVPKAQTVGYTRDGNFSCDPSGRLTRDPGGLIYTGAQIIRRDCVTDMQEDVFSLNLVWDDLLRERTAHGLTYPGGWADVGTPQAIPLAEGMLHRV